jgi:hypothetical protein
MTKQPILNALAAIAYIIIVASVMHYGSAVAGNTGDTLFAPIAMISLFTLSAAVMGYIFLAQPVQLYLDDKKKEAVALFTQTVAVFAGLTAVALVIFFSGFGL